MNTREQRNCAECGEPIPSKNKQDCCDACIAQEADKKEGIAKIVGALLGGIGTIIAIIKVLAKRR